MTNDVRSLFRVIPIVATVLFMPASASAFKPDDAGHLGITSEALSGIERTDPDDNSTLKFSDRAIKQIRDANKDTDCLLCQGIAFFHFDDESFGAATARLVLLKSDIISLITDPHPNGALARKGLGSALHTLQDFYAHSTWVELGNGDIDTRLGESTFDGLPLTTATCPQRPDTLGGAGFAALTSGWFKIPLCDPPDGKCRHGVPFVCPSGLNKDDASRPGYTTARALAVQASIEFINHILDDNAVAGHVKAIKALMDIRSTLGMIIDTTGSMGGEIDDVKIQVAQIVDSVRDTDDEPEDYLLTAFNDPDVGDALVTTDADAFIQAVGGLTADGGGDCPELAMTGLFEGIAASRSDSTLYLFTDASAKDESLTEAVIAAAKKKRIEVTALLFGSCSPVEPGFIRITSETGGQLFLLQPSQANETFSIVRPRLARHRATLFTADAVPGNGAIAVPIDSTIRRVSFEAVVAPDVDFYSFTGDTGDRIRAVVSATTPGSLFDPLLTLFDSAGAVIANGDSSFNGGTEIEFTLPQTGTYFLSVTDVLGNAGADFTYDLTLERRMLVDIGQETEPNDDFGNATPIATGNIINGAIDPGGDIDVYTFAGQAGKTIRVEITAAAVGSSLDSIVTLYDSAGTVLAENDDSFGLDSALTFQLPADGTYFLGVRDYASQGGPDFFYAMSLESTGTLMDAAGEVEPNDNPSMATRIAFGNVKHGTVSGDVDVTVRRPSGEVVADGDPGTTIKSISTQATIITIEAPVPGIWHIELGGGTYSVDAVADSVLELASFEFVEETGRPAHEGLFAIPGQPLIGGTQTALASVLGPVGTADFKLLSTTGSIIETLDLARGNPLAASDEFVGNVVLPSEPFRVAVTGTDVGGAPYQRVFPALLRAQGVEVRVDGTPPTQLPPGGTADLSFIVHNLGTPAVFDIVVADNHRFVGLMQPTFLTLGSGETGRVDVQITIPDGTPDGTNVSITATATSRIDSESTNTAILDLSVVQQVDSDGDGLPDDTDACPNTPRGQTVDGTGCSCSEKSCDDGKVCTTDSCDGTTAACVNEDAAAGVPCDDGDACTRVDTCDGTGSCIGISTCGDGTVQASCGEQCDDGNLLNGDGCSSTCHLEATSTFTPTPPVATPTPTETIPPAATPTETPVPTTTPAGTPRPAGLDHFQCYDVHDASPAPIGSVGVADEFGGGNVEVLAPKRICNPADTNGDDPTAPSHPDHLVAYKLGTRMPPFALRRNQTVIDQFGTLVLDVMKPEFLLVPSGASLTAPVPLGTYMPGIDHFTCYRVSGARRRVSSIRVADQFGTLRIAVKRPLHLCVPTDENGAGIIDRATHLMCYQIRSDISGAFHAHFAEFVDNEFGPDRLNSFRPTELCLPAAKKPGGLP